MTMPSRTTATSPWSSSRPALSDGWSKKHGDARVSSSANRRRSRATPVPPRRGRYCSNCLRLVPASANGTNVAAVAATIANETAHPRDMDGQITATIPSATAARSHTPLRSRSFSGRERPRIMIPTVTATQARLTAPAAKRSQDGSPRLSARSWPTMLTDQSVHAAVSERPRAAVARRASFAPKRRRKASTAPSEVRAPDATDHPATLTSVNGSRTSHSPSTNGPRRPQR